MSCLCSILSLEQSRPLSISFFGGFFFRQVGRARNHARSKCANATGQAARALVGELRVPSIGRAGQRQRVVDPYHVLQIKVGASSLITYACVWDPCSSSPYLVSTAAHATMQPLLAAWEAAAECPNPGARTHGRLQLDESASHGATCAGFRVAILDLSINKCRCDRPLPLHCTRVSVRTIRKIGGWGPTLPVCMIKKIWVRKKKRKRNLPVPIPTVPPPTIRQLRPSCLGGPPCPCFRPLVSFLFCAARSRSGAASLHHQNSLVTADGDASPESTTQHDSGRARHWTR